MRRSNLIATLLMLSGSLLPAAVAAQQSDTSPSVNQPQTQNTPVQPERTPAQADQMRKQQDQSAEDTRINRDWTTRRDDDRMNMDRMRQGHMGRMMEQDDDRRTVGRNWRYDGDTDRRSKYSDRDRGYYDEDRPRRRVKTCIEYENGEEFCRYRNERW